MRIRSTRPDRCTDHRYAELSIMAAWAKDEIAMYCDDHGRGKADPRIIHGQVFPLRAEFSIEDLTMVLEELERKQWIIRYEVDGVLYLAFRIDEWHDEQRPNRPARSKLPAPPVLFGCPEPGADGYCSECAGSVQVTLPESSPTPPGGLTEPSLNEQGTVTEHSLPEGEREKEREKGGGDAQALPPNDITATKPEDRCDRHMGMRTPPACGPCADARKALEAWNTGAADREHRRREARRLARNAAVLEELRSPPAIVTPTGKTWRDRAAAEQKAATG